MTAVVFAMNAEFAVGFTLDGAAIHKVFNGSRVKFTDLIPFNASVPFKF